LAILKEKEDKKEIGKEEKKRKQKY